LLNRCVAREEVLDTAVRLAEGLCRQPAQALRLTKQRLRAMTDAAFEAALDAAIAAQKAAYASGEPQAAMRRFFESRQTKAAGKD
jgi:enoyl-CoA hydratase/carnithine racemase